MNELLQMDTVPDTQENRLQALATDLEDVMGRHGYGVRNEDTSSPTSYRTTYGSKDGEVTIELTPEAEVDA